jgi:exosortase
MSGYFVWERWDRLKTVPLAPTWWGLVALSAGLGMLVLGSLGAELYLQRSSFVVVLCGLVWTLMGAAMLRNLGLPLAFLLFMIPLPSIILNTIAFPLQLFAAKVASYCLFSLSIPVLREGNIIMLTGTTLEVAEACSGIRSLQALLALGAVYAYFTQQGMLARWLLVLMSIPIAILANVIRVSGTGILAEYWGVEAAQGFYHTFEGWLIFLVAFVMLLGTGALISRLMGTPAAPSLVGMADEPKGHP